MQKLGIDYNKKCSPVAQASLVRVVLAIVLYYYWKCELVDIEAAFLEGRLNTPTYISLPPGLVELGFMNQGEYNISCIELQGGMQEHGCGFTLLLKVHGVYNQCGRTRIDTKQKWSIHFLQETSRWYDNRSYSGLP